MFFTSLVDYYSERGDLREVERLATRQLAVDTATQSALLARSIARLGLEDFDGCISDGEKLLRRDSTQLEITYYIGAAYLAKAHQAAPSISASGTEYRKAKTLQKEFYRKAETAFESYRKEYPERRDRWAPMLYKVYLALNEGKKFAEIERILQEERK